MPRSKQENLDWHYTFPGFRIEYHEKYFTYPNLLEEHWFYLSGSEIKCLTFILRQTLGFHKRSDWISYSQFMYGIGETNRGTGLSNSQVRRAVNGLEEKGFIVIHRYRNRPCRFFLVLEDDDPTNPNSPQSIRDGMKKKKELVNQDEPLDVRYEQKDAHSETVSKPSVDTTKDKTKEN